MELNKLPALPQINTYSIKEGIKMIASKDGGLFYINENVVFYISGVPTVNLSAPIRTFVNKKRIKHIDCDIEWKQNKYFALSTEDDLLVYDFNNGKYNAIKIDNKKLGNNRMHYIPFCFLNKNRILTFDLENFIIYHINSKKYEFIESELCCNIEMIKSDPSGQFVLVLGSDEKFTIIGFEGTKSEFYNFSVPDYDKNNVMSISFWVNSLQKSQTSVKSKTSQNRKSINDEIFDIYDFGDDIEEFGIPIRKRIISTSDEDQLENVENATCSNFNENFNYAEACQNLKDDILANKNRKVSEDNKNEEANDAVLREINANSEERQNLGSASDEMVSSYSVSLKSFESNQSIKKTIFQDDIIIVYTVNADTIKIIGCNNVKNDQELCITHYKFLDRNDVICNSISNESVTGLFSIPTWINKEKISFQNFILHVQSVENDIINYETINLKDVQYACSIPESSQIWLVRPMTCICLYDHIVGKEIVQYDVLVPMGINTLEPVNQLPNIIAFATPSYNLLQINATTLSSIKISHIEPLYPLEKTSVYAIKCSPVRCDLFACSIKYTNRSEVQVVSMTMNQIIPVRSGFDVNQCLSTVPFENTIYSLDWMDDETHIFVCCNSTLYVFNWLKPVPVKMCINHIKDVTSVCVRGDYLLTGMNSGSVALYMINIKDSENETDFMDCRKNFILMNLVKIGVKYISEISWCRNDVKTFAACSYSGEFAVLNVNSERNIEIYRKSFVKKNTSKYISGTTSIRWNNNNDNKKLVTCNINGNIKVWNVSENGIVEIFKKKYNTAMLCAIFSPINDNILLCTGRCTTIDFVKIEAESNENDTPTATHSRDDQMYLNKSNTTNFDASGQPITDILKNLNLNASVSIINETDNSHCQPKLNADAIKKQNTICYLLRKEINRKPLSCLYDILKEESNDNRRQFAIEKLFGDREQIQSLLEDELQNHRASNTNSIGVTLIPQIAGNLKEHILEKIQYGKLTEHDIALAPTISFNFWQNCCTAYAEQLLADDLKLSAIPYLLATHKVNESIEKLRTEKLYREAWIIAKLYKQEDDPVIESVVEEWIKYTEMTGNLEGAALLWYLKGNYTEAKRVLLTRRIPVAAEIHQKVLNLLTEKCST